MLEAELIKEILKNQISFDQYIVMESLRQNSSYLYPEIETKLKSTYDTLLFFGYIHNTENNWKLTVKGITLLRSINESVKKDVKVEKRVNKYEQLFITLQNELAKVNGGKKQVKANGEYYFLPNIIDFEAKLSKVEKKYKLTDFDKIKNTLINHIIRSKKQNWDKVTLLGYFIEKSGVSLLATEYEDCLIDQIKPQTNQIFDI